MKKQLALGLGLVALLSACLGCGQSFTNLSNPSANSAIEASKVTNAYTLFIGPEKAEAPVLELIKNATKSIDMSMYLLSNQSVIDALAAAAKRGIQVRLILDRNPFNPETPHEPLQTNQNAAKALIKEGVRVGWSDPAFRFNHSKYFLVDRSVALVSTANFTNHGLNMNRELLVSVKSPSDVAELVKTFNGDWIHQHYQTKDAQLVISPYNSRSKLLGLMQKAEKSIHLEVEVFSDELAIQTLLQLRAQKKIEIQVLLAEPGRVTDNALTAKTLMDGGISVKYLIAPFLHAKAFAIDEKEAYIGSINFTRNSMDGNREVGLILDDPAILAPLSALWSTDWSKAVEPGSYVPAPSAKRIDLY